MPITHKYFFSASKKVIVGDMNKILFKDSLLDAIISIHNQEYAYQA